MGPAWYLQNHSDVGCGLTLERYFVSADFPFLVRGSNTEVLWSEEPGGSKCLGNLSSVIHGTGFELSRCKITPTGVRSQCSN